MQPRHVDRLGQEVDGAEAQRGDGVFDRRVTGDDDDVGLGAAELRQQVHAAGIRQLDVEQRQVVALFGDGAAGLRDRGDAP